MVFPFTVLFFAAITLRETRFFSINEPVLSRASNVIDRQKKRKRRRQRKKRKKKQRIRSNYMCFVNCVIRHVERGTPDLKQRSVIVKQFSVNKCTERKRT